MDETNSRYRYEKGNITEEWKDRAKREEVDEWSAKLEPPTLEKANNKSRKRRGRILHLRKQTNSLNVDESFWI